MTILVTGGAGFIRKAHPFIDEPSWIFASLRSNAHILTRLIHLPESKVTL